MDKQVFSKFNLYDQIGYLMVGSIAIIILVFNVYYFYGIKLLNLDIDTFLIWFIIAYFFGHVIQGITNLISVIPILNILIKEDKKKFSDEEKETLKDAEKYFKIKKQDESKLWSLCYTFSLAKDITAQVQVFNANYSLYRGWLIVFLLQSLFILYQLLFQQYSLQILWLFIGSIFFTFLFYKRSKRFWNYMRSKVLETFTVVKALNL